MTDLGMVQTEFRKSFKNIREVGPCILRGERHFKGNPFAIAYIDLSDKVIERAKNIREFQERIMGADFFDLQDGLRWNNYFYLIAGPNSRANETEFKNAKAWIEADRDYARKFVISERESISLLGESALFKEVQTAKPANVLAIWSQQLLDNRLGHLISKPTPRKTVIELILKGNAKGEPWNEIISELSSPDRELANAFLRELDLKVCRGVHNRKKFQFSNVTLIYGPNGAGKTTILEAIEHLYCGQNRRSSGENDFDFDAKLETVNRSEIVLSSRVNTKRIKERNNAWYRKDAHYKDDILNGFTRYNFLDTDAAFRISKDLDPDELNNELSHLLMGPGTSELWLYLEKIANDLNSCISELAQESKHLNAQSENIRIEIAKQKEIPTNVSALKKTLISKLRNIRWKLPDDETISIEGNDRKLFELTIFFAERIQSTTKLPNATVEQIQEHVLKLSNGLSMTDILFAEYRSVEKDCITLKEHNSRSVEICNLVIEWIGYLEALAPAHFQENIRASDEIKNARSRLGQFASTSTEFPNHFDSLKLTEAVAVVQQSVESRNKYISELNRQLDTIEVSRKNQLTLVHQLHDAAIKLVATSGNEGACPVCSTVHERSELLSKIAKLIQVDSDAAISDFIASREKEIDILTGEKSQLNSLRILQALCKHLDVDSFSTTVLAAKGFLSNLHAMLSDAIEHHKNSEIIIESLSKIRLDRQRCDELSKLVTTLLPSGVLIDDLNAIKSYLRGMEESAQQYLDKIIVTEGIQKAILNQLINVIEEFFPQAVKITEIEGAFKFIQEQQELLKECQLNLNALYGCMELKSDDQLRLIILSMLDILSLFDMTLHAIKQEELSVLSGKNLQGDLDLILTRETKIRAELSNANNAHSVLTSLRENASLDSANKNVLESIRRQINEVFSRIHSPREYELDGSSNALLKSLRDDGARSLDQVSTGQRAAFALSIFLALNSTAISAPPILLIDDPVAHVDDLNSLSFLDYLRDLALVANRQIVFATADIKLANLFRKKFDFWDGFFSEIVLDRRI